MLTRPKGSEGHHKDLGDRRSREWVVLDQDGVDLAKVPRGEGAQDRGQEGLGRRDGLTREEWGAPRHRAILAVARVGTEAVAGMEETGGREAEGGLK